MATVKSILVVHPKYGQLVSETFLDEIQHQIFLKMLHTAVAMGNDFTTYNGKDFFIHVPSGMLKECLIVGQAQEVSMSDVVVAKSQDVSRSSEQVVNTVLSLRGFGTTNLAQALTTAGNQLARSRAGRRVTILFSDCRSTVEGDAVLAGSALEELVVIAPVDDDAEARVFAQQVGARFTTVSGPSDVPDALRRVLD